MRCLLENRAKSVNSHLMQLFHLNFILGPVFGDVLINSLIVYALSEIHIPSTFFNFFECSLLPYSLEKRTSAKINVWLMLCV